MADKEIETEVELEIDDNKSEETETIETETEEITYEQAMKWKTDLSKASWKIAELKKNQPKKKPEQKQDTSQDLELRLFFIENPEYKDNKDWIMEILHQDKYKTLTPAEAQALYLLNKPKESKTNKKDFIGGWYKAKPKSLTEIDDKEAINLSPTDYIKRLKQRWEL